MGTRLYNPGLGVFTAEDSVAGTAADPLSMNRFLYAEADPSTLIDPDGHAVTLLGGCPYGYEDCTAIGWTSFNTTWGQDYLAKQKAGDLAFHAKQERLADLHELALAKQRAARRPASAPGPINPWALARDPGWLQLQGLLRSQCLSFSGAAGACAALHKMQAAEAHNRDAFCAANGGVCRAIEQAQQDQAVLTVGATFETVLAAAALFDPVPGDEIALGAGAAATIDRERGVAQELEELGAAEAGQTVFRVWGRTEEGSSPIGSGPFGQYWTASILVWSRTTGTLAVSRTRTSVDS